MLVGANIRRLALIDRIGILLLKVRASEMPLLWSALPANGPARFVQSSLSAGRTPRGAM